MVIQVAEHLTALFSLRFEKAGSLYCMPLASKSLSASTSSTSGTDKIYEIGPVVSGPFFRSLDGIVDYATTDLHTLSSLSNTRLHSLRGPFTSAGDYLAHYLRALLFKCTEFPNETMEQLEDDEEAEGDDEDAKLESHHEKKREILQRAERVLQKAITLCGVYPGDAPVYPGASTPKQPFTLRMDDFRLVNILVSMPTAICYSFLLTYMQIDKDCGKVNGYIDFEGTTTAPLWLAATVPQWIPNPDGDTASWYGGSPEDQRRVWDAFHAIIDQFDVEWRKAYEYGKLFRRWADYLELGVEAWGSEDVEQWVDARLAWASEEGNRGVPMPEDNDEDVG